MLRTTSVTLSRKLTRLYKQCLYSTSSSLTSTYDKLEKFRTSETDCSKHSNEHLAQFYEVAQEDKKRVFTYGGLPKTFETQIKTFHETCIMIRQPAIDVINCLKTLDYSKPAVRFVLYGKKGCGKSLSLAHILHFASKENFLIVHVPWVSNWMRRCKEYSNSEKREGYVDLNLDGAAWLVHFKSQNSHLLSTPEAKTSKEYVWSKREVTPKDSPISDIIDHGINRVKYASEAVVALCAEIKELTNRSVFKTLVAIDGFNAFFYPKTRVYTEKKEVVHPHNVTLTEGFLNLSKTDWKNAAIIVTVDEIAIAAEDHISHLPRYLLGKEGFEHLDPFVPISVSEYNEKEFLSCMEYYRDRKWVQGYPGQDEELRFISTSNPYGLMKMCASL
ncbi:mitochondrial ribosomal protein S29 [Leptinotarsa decemlineata]|uniref:mitochondrial ribosomal protein S29 n=1 Tax=Leptinotarsa decemlineata TaxID=7539 RepID=UPI000C253B05|nr:28S ribosomal protein S29, mitochondrial [Leptinotarsa decemlineata]